MLFYSDQKMNLGKNMPNCFHLHLVAICLGMVFGSGNAAGQPTSQVDSPNGLAMTSTMASAPQVYKGSTTSASPIVWTNFQETGIGEGGERRELIGEGSENSEEPEEIETDRDSFTPSTSTTPSGRLIVESSYSFIDNRRLAETHSFPELLLRYGLTEKLELRLGWNYEVGGGNSISSGSTDRASAGHGDELEEESRLLFGTKLFLSEQSDWTPQSAIIIQGLTPTSGESNLTSMSVTPVVGWSLPGNYVLDFAMRFQNGGEEEDRFNVWSPSTVIKIPVGERSKAHIEYFGVFTDGREVETAQHFISPGIHYLLNQDLEIGWRAGWGLNDQSPNFFINLGIGRQF